MIRVTEFVGTEVEWDQLGVEQKDMWTRLSAQQNEQWQQHCEKVDAKLSAKLLPQEPPRIKPAPPPANTAAPELLAESGSAETDKPGPVTAPIQGNSTKTPRRDSIDPVIALAQAKCRDPKDTNQVWPQMQVLADSEQAPFLASTPKGLKYHKNGIDAFFTRDALDKRLHPEKRKGPAGRR